MRVILEVIEGPHTGESFEFDQRGTLVLGRKKNKKNKRVDVRIANDPYLSRYHLMMEVSPPDCFLRDIGSTNGTRVNGKSVREADLKDGDVIRAGHSEIRVRIDKTQPKPTPVPSKPKPPVEPPSSPDVPSGPCAKMAAAASACRIMDKA